MCNRNLTNQIVCAPNEVFDAEIDTISINPNVEQKCKFYIF